MAAYKPEKELEMLKNIIDILDYLLKVQCLPPELLTSLARLFHAIKRSRQIKASYKAMS